MLVQQGTYRPGLTVKSHELSTCLTMHLVSCATCSRKGSASAPLSDNRMTSATAAAASLGEAATATPTLAAAKAGASFTPSPTCAAHQQLKADCCQHRCNLQRHAHITTLQDAKRHTLSLQVLCNGRRHADIRQMLHDQSLSSGHDFVP